MLLGMGDIHSQLDCKALTDIEGSGAARQALLIALWTEGTKNPLIFPFRYSYSIKPGTQLASSVPLVASLQQPRLSQASCTHCKQTRVIASVVQ